MGVRTFAIVIVLLGAWCSTACGQSETEPSVDLTWKPPKFQFLRQNEDWSGLADVPKDQRTDFWDAIKYVPLSEDGKIWASFGGSLQLRLEAWWNFNFLPSAQGDDVFLLSRIMLHGDFHFGENVRVFVEGKSALATDRSLPGGRRALDEDVLALQQAFIDLRVPLDEVSDLTLRPGRQMYLFGRQRLVSPLPWANTLRTWDGVTGILKIPGWRIDGFGSYFVPVRKTQWNKPDRDIVFYGAHAAGKFSPGLGIGGDVYFFGLNNKQDQTFNGTTGPEDRYTLGSRVHGKAFDGQLDYDAEVAYQFGRIGAGDVSAWMAGLIVGWTFQAAWATPRIFGGIEYGSGDRNPGGDVQTFNQLFPLGHAYLGYADVFGRQNIIGPNLGVQIKPLPSVTVTLTGLAFWRDSTNDDVYGVGGQVFRSGALSDASELAQELDLTVSYQLDRHTNFLFGYSHVFPGDFFQQSGPANDINFLYAQLIYNF